MSVLGSKVRRNLIKYVKVTSTQFWGMSKHRKSHYCCNYEEVKQAMKAIKPYIKPTPLVTSTFFDKQIRRNVVLKPENMQTTGSFKIRGATNAVLKLRENTAHPNCIVTHSSGNHGQALAKASKIIGGPCFVVMPKSSTACKVEAVEAYGATVKFCPDTHKGRGEVGADVMREHSGVFIHPSQNADVIAGQGTIGIEILEEDPDVDTIVVPIGGGGLISGIALAAKAINPYVKIIGAEPEIANDCEESKRRGELTPLTEYPSTIADGARINIGTMTWPFIRDLVDDVITVSEREIKEATILTWKRLKLVIEPTSGLGVAAVLSPKFDRVDGKKIAVVLCGGNVDLRKVFWSFV